MVLSSRKKAARESWIPNHLWNQVKRYMPIPCLDVVLENSLGEVLIGWRRIPPYRNVWALPGGRFHKGERIQEAAERILAEYDLSVRELFLVGVFPIGFPSRFDLSICVASSAPDGRGVSDGKEFSALRWTKHLPKKLGKNYRQMILRWQRLKSSSEALKLNKLT